ncbi:hypothetical protein FQN54_008836 [Arachnomyces sp. PD_36]|nr:hypothetical protein FQN54_008836 [Arachnomyces sp. PD_36]
MSPAQPPSFFSLPLALWQQPQSYRITKFESKKRDRNSRNLDRYDSDDDDIVDDTSTRPSTPGSSALVLTPNEAHQYRIAGLSFDSELPGGNFPHAPPPSEAPSRINKKDIDVELSKLSPPIYEPKPSSQNHNPRLQHLSVLTTVLHRFILEGDYVRAGRAWGLILREEFGGIPVDVRTQGRWGIGAEILLRRDMQNTSDQDGNHRGIGKTAQGLTKPWFTRKGFEEAKNYYERLILQYPYRRSSPNSTGPLDFYPAMFGLWVYIVQEESKSAREMPIDSKDEWDSADESREDEDISMSSDIPSNRNKMKAAISQIYEKELQEAEQIAARMDEIMVSPPYSDSVELLRLRGMISLWIGDLQLSKEGIGEDDGDSLSPEPGYEDMESTFARRQQRRSALEKRDTEIDKASELFDKAKRRTKAMSLSLESLHIEE